MLEQFLIKHGGLNPKILEKKIVVVSTILGWAIVGRPICRVRGESPVEIKEAEDSRQTVLQASTCLRVLQG